MAEEALTTMKVYRRDVDQLTVRYGAPQWRAFQKALENIQCEHDPERRRYMTVQLGDEFDVETWVGFYCPDCELLIFPGLASHLVE